MNRKRSTRCCGWSFSHGQEWCGYVNFDRESGRESERSGEDLPVALSPPLDSCVRACVCCVTGSLGNFLIGFADIIRFHGGLERL